MKVIALTLCLAALVVAEYGDDLQLRCTREEVGIRWPSYYSNSEYYICQREGARQTKMQCPAGEVFTFVLQVCTTPNRFIPPPPMDVLPTSAPMAIQPIPDITRPIFPRPIHPVDNNPMHPPIIVDEHPPLINLPEIHPPVVTDNEVPEELPAEEIPGPPSKPPVMPPLPGKPKPQVPSKKPEPAAPLPPTPAPTPPVVQVTQPPKKQAVKKPPTLPNAGKKQPPSPPSAAKKQPPKPAGKKTGPKPPSKA